MKSGDQIPAVAVRDLRLMWNVRQEYPTTKIDVTLIQPLATECADLVAAGLRADLLWMIVSQAPEAFGSLLDAGRPSDVLFDGFAHVPIQTDTKFNLDEFLNTLKTKSDSQP